MSSATPDPSRYIIHADPDIRDLIPTFLCNRETELSLFLHAANENDFEKIMDLAHKLKGSAAGYGFMRLSEIACALEKAGKDQDSAAVTGCISQIQDFLSRVQVIYE